MRGCAIAASFALSLFALSASPVLAQTPAAPAKPAPAQPRPAAPAAQAPTQPTPAPAAPPAQPPAPFPAGAKIAFFNPQAVFQASADGRAAVTRVNALIQKKQTENADKAKLLQGNQQKLQTSGSVMNETARIQLEKEIEKQTKDAERFQQDAQAEINELQQEVQNEFVKKLSPIVEALAVEKGLHLVFNAAESGIAWAAPGLDLTADVIKKLDATAKPAAATPKN
ncbi:MAG TPA: OmpH family outer membrane protein [Vicinamibacterales bacterium]|jgi:Skp family chaperone for outer membrane proteins|nr:OmpH family outer membrane protein [Vicinamibacterales bacterium]